MCCAHHLSPQVLASHCFGCYARLSQEERRTSGIATVQGFTQYIQWRRRLLHFLLCLQEGSYWSSRIITTAFHRILIYTLRTERASDQSLHARLHCLQDDLCIQEPWLHRHRWWRTFSYHCSNGSHVAISHQMLLLYSSRSVFKNPAFSITSTDSYCIQTALRHGISCRRSAWHYPWRRGWCWQLKL